MKETNYTTGPFLTVSGMNLHKLSAYSPKDKFPQAFVRYDGLILLLVIHNTLLYS